MPWNRKTSRRDRKWWSRLLRRNYRAEKREIAIEAENVRSEVSRLVYETYNPDDLPLDAEGQSE